MARVLRIDSAVVKAGAVHFGVTGGNDGLPASRAKTGLSFGSKEEVIAAARAFEAGISDEQLLLLLVGLAYKQTGALDAAALTSMVGKTVRLSLTAGAQLVTVT